MVEVLSGPGNPGMDGGNPPLELPVVLAAGVFPRQLSLLPLQVWLMLVDMTRVGKLLAVRGNSKMIQPEIDSDGLPIRIGIWRLPLIIY